MRSRRLAVTGAIAAALLPAGAVLATAPPSSPPADNDATGTAPVDTGDATMTTAAGDTMTTAAGAAMVAAIFDGDREAVAEVEVVGTEPEWTDYGEDDAPDEGHEYFRMTVMITSLTTDEDTFGVSVGDFVLQDSHGFLDEADNVRTAAQAEADEDVTDEADLASGEAVELTLTFELDTSAEPQSVFYRVGDPDRLVHIGDASA